MRSFERTFFAVLALLGSTLAVACAATPAPEAFEGEPASASRSTKKSTKSSSDSTTGTETPPPASTTVADRPAPVEDTPPPAAPVQATDTTWTGVLAKTPSAKFGGDPYCEYQTHFESVNVTVILGADGKVKSAKVTGQAVEESLNGCPNKPIAPNQHVYTLATQVDGTTFSVDGGGSTAEPHAKMDADVSASGTTGTIKLKLQRDDQTAPLVWTIDTTVSLTRLGS